MAVKDSIPTRSSPVAERENVLVHLVYAVLEVSQIVIPINTHETLRTNVIF
jgi:hypothetical protein